MTEQEKALAVERTLAGEAQCNVCRAWQRPTSLTRISGRTLCRNWKACFERLGGPMVRTSGGVVTSGS